MSRDDRGLGCLAIAAALVAGYAVGVWSRRPPAPILEPVTITVYVRDPKEVKPMVETLRRGLPPLERRVR